MPTATEILAQEMRNELEARLRSYRIEREQLLKAQVRIAELEALIAECQKETTTIPIAPRPKPTTDSGVKNVSTQK